MTLKGDIHQTRVKNSFFGDPNFSVPVGAISLIFVLFERAYQDPEHDEALSFKILLFMWKKIDKLKVSKNSLKMEVYLYKYRYNNKNKA